MRISDWSSDVCSSDLTFIVHRRGASGRGAERGCDLPHREHDQADHQHRLDDAGRGGQGRAVGPPGEILPDRKSVAEGKSVSVRVDLGGRRMLKKKYNESNNE